MLYYIYILIKEVSAWRNYIWFQIITYWTKLISIIMYHMVIFRTKIALKKLCLMKSIIIIIIIFTHIYLIQYYEYNYNIFFVSSTAFLFTLYVFHTKCIIYVCVYCLFHIYYISYIFIFNHNYSLKFNLNYFFFCDVPVLYSP